MSHRMFEVARRSCMAAITRRYPFYSGCGALANHRLMKVLVPTSSELVWAKTAAGTMRVRLDDHVGRSVYLFGDLDPKITWILKRLLKSGDYVFDIGANCGLVTLLMSKLVGSQGVVHAFEPNPTLLRMLEETLASNPLANVKTHAIALGAADAEMDLCVPEGNAGAASLVRRDGRRFSSVHKVRVARLDDIVMQEGVSQIALMKIDVEGFECEVLKGGREVLQRLRPTVILFESNDHSPFDEVPPAMKLLSEYGYRFLMIPRCLVRMRSSVVDFGCAGNIRGNDFVAIRNGAAFASLCKLLRAA